MSNPQAELIDPTESLQDEYLSFVAESGDAHIDGVGPRIRDGEMFADFVRRLKDAARGLGIHENYVPSSVYWLVRGGRMLGICSLRHELNERLRDYGGHIGYSVRPSERRKGYATLMLALVLDKARQRGNDRVLITCDKDNIASARVILKNGGLLESEGVDPQDGKLTQRYWIELGPAGGPPQERLELVEPSEALREAYIEFADEFHAEGDSYIANEWEQVHGDFPAFLKKLRDYAAGINLPEGWVSASSFWLVRDGRVVGACGLRHRLTEFLRDFGGHVGYGVRKSERRKGYATFMLRAMLAKAGAMGIDRVLLTCDPRNIASAAVIRKCGGVLESESFSQAAGRVTQRYWIDTCGRPWEQSL